MSLVPWRALDRFEPSERLPPVVALSATCGERVPPLTLFFAPTSGVSLKQVSNTVGRSARQGRPPRAALRAPSIAECFVTGLRRCRNPPPFRGFATSLRLPTLIRPCLRGGQARQPLPQAHHLRALMPRAARRLLQPIRSASTRRWIGETLFPSLQNRGPARGKSGASLLRGDAAEMLRG